MSNRYRPPWPKVHFGIAFDKIGMGGFAALLSVSCGGANVTATSDVDGATASPDADIPLDALDSSPDPSNDGSANDDPNDGGSADAANATADATDGTADVAACDELGASFSLSNNPNSPWSFGWRDDNDFHLYPDHGPADGTSAIIFWYTQQPNQLWNALGTVGKNPTDQVVEIGGTTTLQPGQVVIHPAQQGQKAVVRWTAPRAGAYQIDATFSGVAGDNGTSRTTTDVHVFVAAQEVVSELINLNGRPNSLTAMTTSILAATDTIEFRVGYGNANWTSDSTALAAKICAK